MSKRGRFQTLLATGITFCLLVFTGVLSAQGNSANAFARVKEVQERHTKELMAKEGVVGTAVGFNDADQQAVLVLLERGGVAGIAQNLEGVPVHPVVTGKIYALKAGGKAAPSTIDPKKWFNRPVPIGVSTGHSAITAGTIGCRVKDSSGKVYALSNNHVYANSNNAKIGDNVLQPGRVDGEGTVAGRDDVIGTLASFQKIDFAGADNTVDAAIAAIIYDGSTPRVSDATPSNGYGIPSKTWVAAYVRQPVQKYGRTTSLTKGRVSALNATVNINYGNGVARFVGQIIITPGTFSAGGDSGSLIVTNDTSKSPVGLLFAGSSSHTIANPIGTVLSSFGTTVVTVDGQ